VGRDAKEIVRQYFAAGDRNDFDAWDELCSPDMILYPGFMEPIQGLEAIKQFTAGMHDALSDLYLTAHDLIAQGDRVAVRWNTGGTHTSPFPTPAGVIPPTGKRLSMSGMSILRVADGRIVEERSQGDILGFMQQLGVIPQPQQGSA
jgi:predicted ester cyclase